MTNVAKLKKILRMCEQVLEEQQRTLTYGQVTDLASIISVEAFNNHLKGAQNLAMDIKKVCEVADSSWEDQQLRKIYPDKKW